MDVHCQQAQLELYRPRRPAKTVRHQVVQGHLETVLAAQDEAGSGPSLPMPSARCGDCGHDFLIAFSCKGRGVCPSCNTRRMPVSAAHLSDHVLPPVALRQWVLSVPRRLRWHLHHQPGALDTALRILLDAIERHLRTQCDGAGPNARGRAVAFIHRFVSALNAHTYFHVCAMDGLFEPDGEGVSFHAAPAPSPGDIAAVQIAIRQRTLRAFQRRGWPERGDRFKPGRLGCSEAESQHYGGVSSRRQFLARDASVVISGGDRCERERLLRAAAVCWQTPRMDQRRAR